MNSETDPTRSFRSPLPPPAAEPPSWLVGVCGVAAVASLLFSALLFLNR
jgi:hypothetical protein